MVLAMKRCSLGLLLGLIVLLGVQLRAEEPVLSTKVGEVESQLFIPDGVKVLRGLYVHAAHYKLNPKDRWAESGRSIGFGHLALNIDLKSTNRPAKLRKALDESLKEFAEKTGHKELLHVPLAGAGHSAGGMVSAILLKSPERTLTLCLDCAWIADPTKLKPEDKSVPTLFTLGAIPDAFEMLPGIEKHFEPARKDGWPWCLGLKWGCAHDWGNAATICIPWTEAIAAARIPADADPTAGPVKLKELKLENGWLGDRATTDGKWAIIAPYAAFKGDKAKAVWLPNRSVAYVWRAMESRNPPVAVEAMTADGKTKLPPAGPKAGRDMIVTADVELTLSASVKGGTAIGKVQFFDGDQLIGEATQAPWQITWKQPASGSHPIMAVWESPDGKHGVSNPALILVRQQGRAVEDN